MRETFFVRVFPGRQGLVPADAMCGVNQEGILLIQAMAGSKPLR